MSFNFALTWRFCVTLQLHLPTYQNNSSVKEILLSTNQDSNSQPYNYQAYAQINKPLHVSWHFMLILLSNPCHVFMHAHKINKIIKTLHWWHMLSPLIITKYSKPLELVLFLILTPRIKCHKYSITHIYIK